MNDNKDNDSSTFYEGAIADSYDRKRFDSKAGALIHWREWLVLKEAVETASKPRRILEVGCGTGRFLEELVKEGYQPTGIDPAADMLKVCREKLVESSGVVLDQGEADQLPYADGEYDFVYSIRVLNQVESPDYAHRAVSEMLRVSKPGGSILIEYMDLKRSTLARKKVRLGDDWVNRRSSGDTRLQGNYLEKLVEDAGARVEWRKGSFFLGMTAYYTVPRVFLGAVNLVDRFLSLCLPSFCSRCYLLVKKSDR